MKEDLVFKSIIYHLSICGQCAREAQYFQTSHYDYNLLVRVQKDRQQQQWSFVCGKSVNFFQEAYYKVVCDQPLNLGVKLYCPMFISQVGHS